MDEKYITEKLNSIRNEMSHMWGIVFVSVGGAFTLLATPWNVYKVTFAIFMLVLTALFINAYFNRRSELLDILKRLKQEETDELGRYI